MTISYLYWKTGQGVNFGSCEEAGLSNMKKYYELRGYKWEIEASTPELRAEQLRRIREQK